MSDSDEFQFDDDDARLSSCSDRQRGTRQSSSPSSSDSELSLFPRDDSLLVRSSSDRQLGTGQSSGTSSSDSELSLLPSDDDAAWLRSSSTTNEEPDRVPAQAPVIRNYLYSPVTKMLNSGDRQRGTGQSSGPSFSDSELYDGASLSSSDCQKGAGQNSGPSAEQRLVGRDSRLEEENSILKKKVKGLEDRVRQLERPNRSHDSLTLLSLPHLRQGPRSESDEGEFSAGTLSNRPKRRKFRKSFRSRSVPYTFPRQTRLPLRPRLVTSMTTNLSDPYIVVPIMNALRLLGNASFSHIYKLRGKKILKALNLQDPAEQPDTEAC